MTTYRCAGCGKDVEVEEIYITGGDYDKGSENVIEISPCEVCIGAAEEAVKEESYDKGFEEGWQSGYETMSEEIEEEKEDKK